MLEAQYCVVVDALGTLYRRCYQGKGFPGGPLQENGESMTHLILKRLGLVDLAERGARSSEDGFLKPMSRAALTSARQTTYKQERSRNV